MSRREICHLVVGPNTGIRTLSQNIFPSSLHIFLSQHGGIPKGFTYETFWPENFLIQETFTDGSGPVDLFSVVRFVQELERSIRKTLDSSESSEQVLVCNGGPNRRTFTNTTFLLGAYMILKFDLKASDTAYLFRGIDPKAFEPFKDIASMESDFVLSVADCWQALERAKGHSWIGLPLSCEPYRWGQIDIEAYEYYNNPLNADLHEIVPGRLFAMQAPRILLDATYDDRHGRHFRYSALNVIVLS